MNPMTQHPLKTAFIGAIVVGAGLPLILSVSEGIPYDWVIQQRGLLFALMGVGVGLVVGLITIPTTIVLTVPDKTAFLEKLEQAMVEPRYEAIARSDAFLAFRFSGGLKAMAPQITVNIESETAKIAGPKNHVTKLRSRL